MKTTIAFSFLLVASLVSVTTAQAGSSAARGALIGGVAGAIIGSSGDRHDVLAGAAFGATAGALLGAASDDSRRPRHSHGGRSHVSVSYGFGYGHGYSHYRPYHRHAYHGWGYPLFHYSYTRPVYYTNAYELVRPVEVVPTQPSPPAVAAAQPAQSSPENVTIINNYYGGSSPMSSANGMFGR